MKVIIAGSRTIQDYSLLIRAITYSYFEITEVVSGCVDGVDTLGFRWANEHEIPTKLFPADWETFGKSAGPRRNRAMAEYADALILVWDGKSRGSANMKAEAQRVGLKIYEKIV